LNSGLTSADSGLQLNLEIALSGGPSEGPAHQPFLPGRRCVETSGDVIELLLERFPNECRALFATTDKNCFEVLGRGACC
jgi:hypothetical protein